jgi:hypothetical protein
MVDIYQLEQWRDFFLLVGTGAVTLTGLVFVALSLNLKIILVDVIHRYRAVGTLSGLALVFMRCSLVLMGGQNHKAVGAELFVISLLGLCVYLYGIYQYRGSGSRAGNIRILSGTSLYLIEMLGAVIFFLGSIAGLYAAVLAMVANVCYMISGAWLLVVGVYHSSKRH